ncbi:CXAR protein, partial [Leptocoma aspasia]|nr:CXAR protein [Leptocoma aspasia]
PVANATITLSPLSHQVHQGDPVTLRCSVQVGSAPVNFTWLHNGQEVAQGPLLELGDIDVGHSGTYQCVATNQLDGQQALSQELALAVTPQGHWSTAVAVNVGRALLFLVLLLAVIGCCHWWHHRGGVPPGPPAPLEEGEELDTHVMGTEQAGGEYGRWVGTWTCHPWVSPQARSPEPMSLTGPPTLCPPRTPQVTHAELPGPHGRLQDTSDIYGNVL